MNCGQINKENLLLYTKNTDGESVYEVLKNLAPVFAKPNCALRGFDI
jgi:hypothetical protein